MGECRDFKFGTQLYMACDLSVIVKNEQVLKVTGSHVYFKIGSI